MEQGAIDWSFHEVVNVRTISTNAILHQLKISRILGNTDWPDAVDWINKSYHFGSKKRKECSNRKFDNRSNLAVLTGSKYFGVHEWTFEEANQG